MKWDSIVMENNSSTLFMCVDFSFPFNLLSPGISHTEKAFVPFEI